MLSISPIGNNYYNKSISFKAKQTNAKSKAETQKNNPYADLYAKMRELEILAIEEQEVIPPPKKTANGKKTTKTIKLETLPADEDGQTELYWFCVRGNLEEFKKFVKEHPNFDPNQRKNNGVSYIYTAANAVNGPYIDILNLLAANKNLDLNITDTQGRNDMHELCWLGCVEVIKTFVENHPDFNPYQLTKDGSSYIDIAKRNRHQDIADYLTKYIKHKKLSG